MESIDVWELLSTGWTFCFMVNPGILSRNKTNRRVMEMDHTQNLWHLPRGGLLISTSSGPVQFGVPPETIKDSMTIDIGVPSTFILPPLLFSMDQGISFSELEFPIYYNFFFRKRKIRVVCTQNQKRRVLTLLNEALFGPEKLDYAGEFINGQDTPG